MGIPHGVLPTAHRLGRLLESQRKKVLGERMLEGRVDHHTKRYIWRVVEAKAKKR